MTCWQFKPAKRAPLARCNYASCARGSQFNLETRFAWIKSGYTEEEEERKKFCLNQEEEEEEEEEDNGVVKRIISPQNSRP